jgi:hypothetical protein
LINDKDAQERTIDDEREKHQRASQHFSRSLFRAGVGLALLPISVLPPEPQQHFKVAGREFAHGLAKLVHQLADRLDGMAEAAYSPHTDRETDVSQV